MKKIQLIELINSAFNNRIKPSGISDASHENFPEYEGNVVAAFFSKRNREDITTEVLENEYPGDYSACLSFMRHEAAAYYLPIFMILCINDYDSVDVLPFSLATILCGGLSKQEQQWTASLAKELTNQQKVAVVEYIEYMKTNYKDDLVGLDIDASNRFFMNNEKQCDTHILRSK